MIRCVVCPTGLGCPNSLLLDGPDPDSLSSPTMPLTAPDFDAPSYPLPNAEAEAPGDPGETTEPQPRTIRVRLQLGGEWRFVRGEWYPGEGVVDVYGNADIELDTRQASSLAQAVEVTAEICFGEFRE